ncbi:MAG: hypothetical protein ACW964_12475 [Candidatus Hodarchaeales archaeon]|jgi:hypothetical protein
MEDEISYLLRLPSEEIMKAVLQEALKDLEITVEEEILISGLKKDLIAKTKQLPKLDRTSPFTKQELQYLLIEQRNKLKEIIRNTYNRAFDDKLVTIDEMNIYRTLIHKVDEISAKKIGLFIDLDLNTKEPHLFSFHSKIGQAFSSLTATIIMDIFTQELNSNQVYPDKETIQDVVDSFSSEESNKEFIIRFKGALRKLINIPTNNPSDFVKELNEIIDRKH